MLWTIGLTRCYKMEVTLHSYLQFLANVNSPFAICHRPSVCRLSATFVRPTQAIEIVGNVSTPFGTLAICWLPGKILRRSSQGTPPSGVLNTRVIAEYSDFGPIVRYILETVQDRSKVSIGSRMSFRFAPIGDLGWPVRRNSPNGRLISPNSVAFGADYVKVVEETPILSAAEM